jgi:N-acetylglutamate synthase-like GNAT family acetyltransferase
MQPINISYKGYTITTDKSQMDVVTIHQWLSTESYWCKNVPFEIVKKSFDNSYCIGVLYDGEQVGFARLITDYATFAYLADVYVIEAHRGKELSKQMMEILMNLDWAKGMRRVMLATLDAHGLYAQFGFTPISNPERLMVIARPTIYGHLENPAN